MSDRYIYNKRIQNAAIRRRLDRRFVSWVLISVFAGAMITFGFVYSARCHFEAVALGYETQQRRTDLDRETEVRRQLELERVRALSPEELEARARRLGLERSAPPVQAPNDESPRRSSRPGTVRP